MNQKTKFPQKFKFYELEPGCVISFYGPRRSGKSTALISAILERPPDGESFYDKHTKAFVFTIQSNLLFFTKYFPEKNIYVGMETFSDVVPKIIKKLENSKTRNCLIIVDDLLTSATKNSKNNEHLNHIVSTSRHYRMSCIMLCQSRRFTNHLIRNNDVLCFTANSLFMKDWEFWNR